MNNTKKFLLLVVLGVIILVLEFCFLKLDGNWGFLLMIIGIFSLFGGMLGASITSEKVKSVVVVILDFLTYI